MLLHLNSFIIQPSNYRFSLLAENCYDEYSFYPHFDCSLNKTVITKPRERRCAFKYGFKLPLPILQGKMYVLLLNDSVCQVFFALNFIILLATDKKHDIKYEHR